MFSFGSKPAAQPSTAGPFSFGQPTQNAAQSQPAPAFGASAPASTGGLFGQKPAGTGLFGSSTTTAAQPAASTSTPFSFGAPASTPAPAGGLFSSFGASQPAQQQQTNTFGSSLFGAPQQQQPNLQSTLQQPAQPQLSLSQSILQGPKAEPSVEDRLTKLFAQWDPSKPECVFQYYVYNIMDNQRAEYVKQNGHQRTSADVNDALWNKALRENPDPARYYPHLIVGHDALKKRVGQQDEFAAKHAGKLEEFVSSVQTLSSQYNLDTSLRISKAQHTQAVLSARLLRLISRLHPLTPLRGAPLRAEEDDLRIQVERLLATFTGKRPTEEDLVYNSGHGSNGKLAARVNEAWVAVAQRKAKKALLQNGGAAGTEWAVINEQEVDKVLDVLAQQQRTLDYLADMVKRDQSSVNVIKDGFGI